MDNEKENDWRFFATDSQPPFQLAHESQRLTGYETPRQRTKKGAQGGIDNRKDLWNRGGNNRSPLDGKDIQMSPILEYILSQPDTMQPVLMKVYSCIKDAIPDTEERISWAMPTFWKGRNIIHFVAAKHHIGLYPGPDAIVAFAEQLRDLKTSKGAIQVPIDKPLPIELISEIARWSYEHNKK